MRVLYVEMAYGFGGSLTGLLNLIDHLPVHVEPVLVTLFDARKYVTISDNLPYEIAPIAPVSNMPGAMWRRLWRLWHGNIAPWMRHLKHLIERYRPALIHTANGSFINLPAAIAGWRADIPTISYQKGFEYQGRPNRYILKHGWYRHFVASSRAIAERLIELGLPPKRCTVMYEPIEPPREAPTAIRAGLPVVAMFSLLQPWKGQEVFLRAIAQVVGRYPEPFRTVVAGTSPDGSTEYPERLRRLAAELRIDERVEFVGHVRQVYEMLRQTDVAVHASVMPEPFGRVIAEGMICGVAVVATQGGGAGEIVQHEKTGLHVPMGDVEALAQAIERLLREPGLRGTLGQNARAFALQAFSPADHAQGIVGLYKRVLDGAA